MSARPCPAVTALVVSATLAAACTSGGGGPAASPSGSVSTSSPARPPPTVAEVAVPRPVIVSKPIPFPASRRQETQAYARAHYGLDTFELRDPKAIVEHFTASSTFEPVFATFAADRPDLGQLPGTCAHFVVDTDGTIYQLVPLDLMCRHTVGLNYTAIGIEMVGQSDQDILGNPAELGAAVDLTLWLMQRFRIELRNVIGHSESLTSPLRRELVPSFRCQTHQDWSHADMETFRGDLAATARSYRLPLGPPAAPAATDCQTSSGT